MSDPAPFSFNRAKPKGESKIVEDTLREQVNDAQNAYEDAGLTPGSRPTRKPRAPNKQPEDKLEAAFDIIRDEFAKARKAGLTELAEFIKERM